MGEGASYAVATQGIVASYTCPFNVLSSIVVTLRSPLLLYSVDEKKGADPAWPAPKAEKILLSESDCYPKLFILVVPNAEAPAV